VTAAADVTTVTDQDSGLYSALFYLFNKFTVAQDDAQSARQYDSPIDYNCKTSIRHNTALTDTLEHTQAVSSADREQCLALLLHATTNN